MSALYKLPETVNEVAKLIDHTILAPSATFDSVKTVAEEGLEYDVASVCVQPIWVSEVSEILKGRDVLCCSVVGLPHGANRAQTIAFEADRAVREGAREIDMVMSVGRAIMGNWDLVGGSISTVKAAIGDIVLKVILEVCELTPHEISTASKVAIEAGADFIKTSTGFGKSGASVKSVAIMADVAAGRVGIKAAGGIKSYDDVINMVNVGATRIGASSTINILNQAKRTL